MSKIYKIDDAEFEELIKTIALNNESIIENNDPVLMFYTIAKYVFKEYASELDNNIDSIGHQQRDIIDEFKIYLDNKKIENDKEFLSKVQLLTNEIKTSTDEQLKETLYFIADKIDNLNKAEKEKNNILLINNFYVKLLLIGNIIL
ncbi:MAG: hypothetical protein MSA07_00655 [Mucispirillum sp.]|nr:hypothetical protein [Mucispirillum sp.]